MWEGGGEGENDADEEMFVCEKVEAKAREKGRRGSDKKERGRRGRKGGQRGVCGRFRDKAKS